MSSMLVLSGGSTRESYGDDEFVNDIVRFSCETEEFEDVTSVSPGAVEFVSAGEEVAFMSVEEPDPVTVVFVSGRSEVALSVDSFVSVGVGEDIGFSTGWEFVTTVSDEGDV